jgi:hypothetical protein
VASLGVEKPLELASKPVFEGVFRYSLNRRAVRQVSALVLYMSHGLLITQLGVVGLLGSLAGILEGDNAALGQEGDELEEDYQCQVKNFHFNETSFLVLSQDRVIIIR